MKFKKKSNNEQLERKLHKGKDIILVAALHQCLEYYLAHGRHTVNSCYMN